MQRQSDAISARAARRHNKMKLAVALALAGGARAPPRGPRDPRHRPHGRRAPQPADGQVRHGPGRPRQVRGPAARQDPGRVRLHRRRLHGALEVPHARRRAREAGRRPPPEVDLRRVLDGPGARRRLEVIIVARRLQGPFRGGDNILVLCDTYDPEGNPLPTNSRAPAVAKFEAGNAAAEKPWYGLEQEYTLFNLDGVTPLGWPVGGFPKPQGPYYCGAGADKILRPRRLRRALRRLPLRGPRGLGHERRGHARPVGVPDRPLRRHRRRRPAHDLALHPRPHLRGPRRHRVHRPQAHQRRLERRGLP